ncbi:PQQ-dependent sugar dehydrogenase [Janibacter alkaliphilus]|uniref:Glucose/arabinose dehydrogenase n=1 Tax=Janibacter alkaliphilus TaxID=1069963 RepID=A0A852XA72_9MICO|nr:PQQ-dependent sugar dehydrogenase [Janibacter alkaliphilus]NYG37254.1 glucose/arabinose dehydrogenase [Janibacter alkaliphilus]
MSAARRTHRPSSRRARLATLACAALVAVTLTACSDGGGGTSDGGSATSTADDGSATTSASSGQGASSGAGEPLEGTPFAVEEVDSFDEPWAMAFLPGGDLLVTERSGTMHLRDQASGERAEVAGVPEVVHSGQGGLGDVLPGPTFADDGTVYLSWAEEAEQGNRAAVGQARLVTDGDEPRLEGLEVIWRQQPSVDGDAHYSHRLAIDPEAEHLYVSSGDRQEQDPAQDTSNTLGTIVRLDLDGVPVADNPLADEDGAAPGIYSYGHRNPLGLELAPDGRLWSSEMGPEGGDELNLVEAGGNYGWPEASNGSDYGGGDIPDHAEGDGFVAPAVSWDPSISPGSLMIYDGELFADWEGDAFLGGLSGESLTRVALDGAQATEEETWEMGERIRAVEAGPDGAIWVLEDAGSGRLLRLTPAG